MKTAAAIIIALVVGITIGALAMRAHDTRIYDSVLYHAGMPAEHADFFDNRNRIIKTLYYRTDGTLGLAKEFDEHGKALSLQPFDPHGNPQEKHMQQ